MAGELNMLARDMARLARQNPRCADFTQNLLRRAIKQIIACFPVYRTYLDGNGELDAADQRDIAWALARARRYETEIDPSVFGYLEQVLTGRLLQQPRRGFSYQSLLRAAMRLQQYSGPVDAKGMEDTALYRYNRLIALNEVGGDPERFGGTVAAFHRACQLRAQRWPNAMLTLATHDTKRGADARARLAALSELPEEWREQLPVWSRILRGPPAQNPEALRPDRNDEYLLYQMLLGSWPTELLQITPADIETPDSRATAALHAYAARIRATMTKSMREARVHTHWAFPTAEYEDAMLGLIDAALTGNRATAFLGAFVPFARRVAGLGAHNSLVQMVLALTTPGVPDLYNGTELWDFSLVDPDNRAPIDFAQCQRLLQDTRAGLAQDRTGSLSRWLANWSTGQIKLAVTLTLLEFRREHPALLAAGDYQPLTVMGSEADEICAFARTQGEQSFICAVARFPRRREQHDFSAEARLTRMPALPGGPWRELLSGRVIQAPGEELPARELFAVLPAAVLVAVPAGS
jgi:(1->4)-alpha-D-glucan 1-alpha-D-glucosylmutase